VVSTLKIIVNSTFNLTIYLSNRQYFCLLLVTISLTVCLWYTVHLTGDAVK
jgi:hypothetical protein